MGHTRLGTIPKSRKWVGVVATFNNPESRVNSQSSSLALDEIKDIAQKTLDAADAGLEKAVDDIGLRYTFFLLTQIVLASRKTDWKSRLGELGIELSDTSTIFDLIAEIQTSIDGFIAKNGRPTDISEIAQKAIGEAIISLAGPLASTLFGNSGKELQYAIRQLSTKKGFSELGQRFFGHFIFRYLNFYLSRFSASYFGTGILKEIGEISHFDLNLKTHCLQSAWIVHDFCGQWYSKTEFQEGINFTNSSQFLYGALKKLRDEMKQQKEEL